MTVKLISGERIVQTSIAKRPEALAGYTKKPVISACTNSGRVLLQEASDWEDITPELAVDEKVIHTSVCEDHQVIVLVTTDNGRLLEFRRNQRRKEDGGWEGVSMPPAEPPAPPPSRIIKEGDTQSRPPGKGTLMC